MSASQAEDAGSIPVTCSSVESLKHAFCVRGFIFVYGFVFVFIVAIFLVIQISQAGSGFNSRSFILPFLLRL